MAEADRYRKNSEILLMYEARLCNPNGDPDDENKPRMDLRTKRNLVSDVRLKRFFRNFIMNKYGEEFVWVTTMGGKHVRADERLGDKKPEDVPKSYIDARLFGAMIPIGKKEKAKGESVPYTGPVQFTWGYSLHPVELVESSTITSMFQGRPEETAGAKYGTIGKDWRLHYSLLAFYGVVSGLRSRNTGLRELDVKILDNLLWRSIALDATTRSKIGEKPHLYLRVEYNYDQTLIGDFRKYIEVGYDEQQAIRDLKDIKLDFSPLIEALTQLRDRIHRLYVRESDEFKKLYDLTTLIKNVADTAELPHDIDITEKSLTAG